MATTSEDAVSLKKALDYDALHKQFCGLQESFKTVSEEKANLQITVDKINIELNTFKSLKEATERSKKETEETLQELEKNESRLRALNTKTLEQLHEKRDALEKAKTELSAIRQNVTELTVQVEHANMNVINLKSTKHDLEYKLSTITTRKVQVEENLKSLQRDYDNFRENSTLERGKFHEQIADLGREKEHASDSADQLRLQLDHAKQNIHIAEDKLNTITKEKEQLKLSLGSASKTYQDLSVLYEEHVAHSEKKISTLENKIKSITEEKSTLLKKIDDLERQLKDEKALCQEYYNQISRIDRPSDEGDTSQLLTLIREYQSSNRRPEDIFQDYFKLRAKYETTITENAHCEKMAETLTRRLSDKEILYNRLLKEYDGSKLKVKELTGALSKKNAECEVLKASNKKLTDNVGDLTKDKSGLEATLNDTTYQLQYLLSDVQRRNEPIPSKLADSSELLSATQLCPSLPHDQLVFKNVAELQDLNTSLVSEVRSLTEKLQSTFNEFSNANVKRDNDVQFYKTAISEAKQTVSELNDKSNDLQKQLNTLTTECNNYKKIVSELGDGDVKDKFDQMLQNQVRQREEMDVTFDSYREETLKEVNLLKEELETTRNSAIEARNQLTKVNVEIAHLNRKQINLTTSIEQRDEELKIARRQNSILQERITSREREVSETKNELVDVKSRAEIASNENLSLTHRIETITTAYNALKDTTSKDSAEKARMNSLFEAINDRMELFANTSSKTSEQLKDSNEKLNRELQHARDTLVAAEKELESYKSIDQQEIKDKYKESIVEIRLLKTKITEIEQQLSSVNQERIIAQTKLAAVEEQLKNVSAASQSEGTAVSTTLENNACNDHIRLLAEAEDRIRDLENDIENYQSVIAESNKKANALVQEHENFVSQSEISINKLIKDLEAKSAAVATVQAEGEKNMAEFKALHDKVVASQNEVINEKHELEEKVKTLDEDNVSKEAEIKTLRELVEEKTTACAEVESQLLVETKANAEHRQTINVLRADVSNLTSEISEYRSNADAVKATMESMQAEFNNTANTWNEYKESLKKSLAESEKQREKLTERVEELVQQHAEWKAAVVKDAGADDSAFEGLTNDILQQLREANETLRVERDANDTRYRYEHEKVKRVEAEIIPLKKQVEYLQADCDRLREENNKLNEKDGEEAGNYRMQCDAFKIQNRALTQENERLRERREIAQAELDKKNAELNPLLVKVEQLEAELKQSQEEVQMLTKAQKEWTSRSAQLLSKYNRVDPAESDRVKSELEVAKSDLESTRAKITELESTIESLTAQVKTAEAERVLAVKRNDDRGRIMLEVKRKYTVESQKQLEKQRELEKKLEELEKKLKTAETASVNTNHQNTSNAKLLKEKETAELAVKTLEEEKEKAEKAKADAELEQKKAEDSLKVRMDEFTALEKKYNHMLQRARLLQQEKFKLIEELKTLRNAEGDKSESSALKQKVTELETELTTLRKTLAENSVELTRLKAQNSMVQNKNNRLQKEVELLRASKSNTSSLSANATPFQVSSPINTPSVVPSPTLTNVQPEKPKTVASPTPTKTQPEIATTIANAPDRSMAVASSPADALVSTPAAAMTPPATSTFEPEEVDTGTPITSAESDPVNTNETEDNTAVTTPITTEPVSASTPTVAEQVDNELSMEADSVANEQAAEDLVDESNADHQVVDNNSSVNNKDETIEEAPVEVEVHEVPAEEKSDPSPIDESNDTVEDTIEENTQNENTTESPITASEEVEEGEMEEKTAAEIAEVTDEEKLVEPTVGSKRKDRLEDAEDDDIPTPGSPSKKLHTSTDETTDE
ncbi:unnamed protein product [Mucor hiemalis]